MVVICNYNKCDTEEDKIVRKLYYIEVAALLHHKGKNIELGVVVVTDMSLDFSSSITGPNT